ncbi:hypothetical protein ACWPKS_15835 [Coraliomargarita sp. W4R72]
MPAQSNQDRQLEMILPELCFPGRAVILSGEIAALLQVDPKHIVDHINDERSALIALNTGRTSRGNYRIPVTSYYAWLASLLTGEPSENPILQLSTPILRKLFASIADRLELRGEHPIALLKPIKRK